MKPSRQQIVEQCREQGRCVLTKEEFEAIFFLEDAGPDQDLTRFCQENDLELIVDAEAEKFIFQRGRADSGPWPPLFPTAQ